MIKVIMGIGIPGSGKTQEQRRQFIDFARARGAEKVQAVYLDVEQP